MKLTAAKGLMEKMAFDVEVCMKQWRVSEFLLKKKKIVFIDIHWHSEHLWKQNSRCKNSEVMGVTLQQ